LDPIITHKSINAADNVIFSHHLRNITDCKVFMIAMILYLEYRNAKELPVYQELFTTIFAGESYPNSMYALKSVSFPELSTSAMLIHAYSIEELLLFFADRENPKKTADITLDKIFNSYKPFLSNLLPVIACNKSDELPDAIEMHTIFRVKPSTPEKTQSKLYHVARQ
jgi:hypothetical protein